MNTRTLSSRNLLEPAVLLFAAALMAGVVPARAEAQMIVDQDRALAQVVAEHGRVEAPVVSRAVLTNADDVQLLARRWYRSLDGANTLGDGDVVVYARILSDGTVAEAFVPEAGPYHPALNGLARRLAMVMHFAPFDADGSTLDRDQLGSTGYWVAQKISFRP